MVASNSCFLVLLYHGLRLWSRARNSFSNGRSNERAVTTYNTHLHIWCTIELGNDRVNSENWKLVCEHLNNLEISPENTLYLPVNWISQISVSNGSKQVFIEDRESWQIRLDWSFSLVSNCRWLMAVGSVKPNSLCQVCRAAATYHNILQHTAPHYCRRKNHPVTLSLSWCWLANTCWEMTLNIRCMQICEYAWIPQHTSTHCNTLQHTATRNAGSPIPVERRYYQMYVYMWIYIEYKTQVYMDLSYIDPQTRVLNYCHK